MEFPTKPCPAGIMANLRFPTCGDGKNLNTPNHQDHMAYPSSGTFESQEPCPATHPVKVPQLMYETVWDTRQFNDPAEWTEGSLFWSMGDNTGYGTHGDYVLGWKDDALQRAMDSTCYVNCPTLKTQSITAMNSCSAKDVVAEQIDGWLDAIPGNPVLS